MTLQSELSGVTLQGLTTVASTSNLKGTQMSKSKKRFHFIKEDGNQPRIRLAFDPAVHIKYNPDTMFHPMWETSNFFDMFLPEGATYGEMSVFGTDEQGTLRAVEFFEGVGRKGLFGSNLPIKATHRVVYGDWDDHGIAMVVPVGCGINKLEDMGVHLTMNSESDKLKVRKYFRRIRAHHEWAVKGEVVTSFAATQGSVLRVSMPSCEFDVLHVDINSFSERNLAMADGIHLISTGLCQYLGRMFNIDKLATAQEGDAFKGTMYSKLGLGKGFFHVVDMDRYGIIIYGPKTQVKFDRFFLGSLGDVNGGDAYTCIQSLGAFINPEVQLWENQAELFMNEVMDSIHDEDALRHLFLTHIAPVAELVNTDTEAWVLVEALRHGVPILRNPGLFRRVVRHLMMRVLDCERGRIPYGPVAHRYNLMPDMNCFDLDTGEVDYTKSVIPEGAVVCMDANQGPFALYRQPLGNAKEAVVTTNFHSRRFRRYIGRDRIILGMSALEQLATMGGGDFDDAVIGTDNLDWIEVIDKAEYPVTQLKDSAPMLMHPLDVNNPFLRKRQYPCNWSLQDYFEAAAKATDQQMSIGPVDNAVRLDLLLSGAHKQNMLANLAERIETATTADLKDKLTESYTWLEDREDFQLREVASNLESFIDYIKMGKGDPLSLEPLVKKIAEVRDGSLVLPECWTYLGKGGKGRISPKRLTAQDYTLAPSLVCDTLNTIRFKRDQLMEALRDEEWLMVERIPETLNEVFPREPGIRDEAYELRLMWRDAWDPFLTGQISTDLSGAYKIILAGGKVRLDNGEVRELEGIRPKFNQWDTDIRMSLAVEIARQTYRTRHTEAQRNLDGRRRGFSDGLLWTNTVGLFYIQALKEAGLTGLYVPVKFDRYSRNLSRATTQVQVTAGAVARKSDGFNIGFVMGQEVPEDGEYTMHDGMICVQEPADELRLGATDVDDELTNPVDISDVSVAM